MKILVIDSHKSNDNSDQQNLHWTNAKILSDALSADLIWSYPTVNDHIKSDYDVIIFNHASRYSFESEHWVLQSPNAKLYYIVNDYNLGEPMTLWHIAKTYNRLYTVIANHAPEASKVVKKYTDNWHQVNLNSLIYNPKIQETNEFFDTPERRNCIYFGSFRKGRIPSFKKYLKDQIILSTHRTNEQNFRSIGCTSPIGSRVQWDNVSGLFRYKFSLYIEDDATHKNYSCLANRFYEALNYDVITMFDTESNENIKISGYNVPDYCRFSSYEELIERMEHINTSLTEHIQENILPQWKSAAQYEKAKTIQDIKEIVYGQSDTKTTERTILS